MPQTPLGPFRGLVLPPPSAAPAALTPGTLLCPPSSLLCRMPAFSGVRCLPLTWPPLLALLPHVEGTGVLQVWRLPASLRCSSDPRASRGPSWVRLSPCSFGAGQ